MLASMDALILKKTDKGMEALRSRDPALPKRLRTAFILFDGNKNVAQVMQLLPSSPALELEDVYSMLQAGWLELLNPTLAPQVPARTAPSAATMAATAQKAAASAQRPSIRNPAERYQQAYAAISGVLGDMGLRGFKLQLAVEKADGYEGLLALLPRLQASFDAQKMRKIERILLEPDSAPVASPDSNVTMPVLIP